MLVVRRVFLTLIVFAIVTGICLWILNRTKLMSKRMGPRRIQTDSMVNLEVIDNTRMNQTNNRNKTQRHAIKKEKFHIDCATFFQNDTSSVSYKAAFRKIMQVSWKIDRTFVEPREFVEITKDCQKFKKERHYILDSLTKEEANFPIGFCITMYKDVEQFEHLLRAIYRPQNTYTIHVDLNSAEDVFTAVQAIAACFDNVFMTPYRVAVEWGSESVLDANLLCMKTLYKKNSKWKYFINLTGQEYPLRTNLEIVRMLKAMNGSNDIFGQRKGFEDRWENREAAPYGIVPTKGSLLISARRDFVQFALYDKRALALLKWVRDTDIPDETYLATLNFNPHLKAPGRAKVFSEASRYTFKTHFVSWRVDMPSCGGQVIRGVCVFGIRDLPLLAVRPEMLANKFYWDYQRAAYICMERRLNDRVRAEITRRDRRDP